MKIIVYGTHCPQCRVIEKKLQIKGLQFEMIDDPDAVVEFGKANNINSMPILVVDDKIMNFSDANKWLAGPVEKTTSCGGCNI